MANQNTNSAGKKTFVGSGRVKSPTWIQVSINPEKLAAFIEYYNGVPFVKLNINIKPADQYGKDVQISIDTFHKDNPPGVTFNQSPQTTTRPAPPKITPAPVNDPENLPFYDPEDLPF